MEAAAAALPGLRGALRAVLAGLRGGEAPVGGQGGQGGGFERGRFWEALAAAVQAASRAATQLSLAASAQELERLSGEAQRAVLAAAAAYSGLPEDQGRTLRRAVRDAVVEVAEGLLRLAEALLRPTPPGLSREQLVSTGGVWEACERAAGLPRDNAAAVASALSAWLGIARDALREVEQALAEGGEPFQDDPEEEEVGSRGDRDVSWSEADRQLLGPCVGLVKAAKACLKKLLGAVNAWGKAETAEQVAQLDDVADAAGDISPSVDELVLSTYPPVNRLTLRLNAGKLAAVLKKMLEVTQASHVCAPSEEGWVQFLSGAVDHNMDKIKDLTQGVL